MLKILFGGIAVFFAAALVVPSLLRSRMSASHLTGGHFLQQLVAHEATWRQHDPDGNGQADYWVKDVAGFHALRGPGGKPIALIDLHFARSDEVPAFWYPELEGRLTSRYCYRFRAMTIDQDGSPYVAERGIPPATAPPALGICTNAARFGFTAIPSGCYSMDGVDHFMVGEDGVVWRKDTGNTAPVADRATAAPPGSDTTWSRWSSE